eukprot:2716696-Pleurochrysis_carterae.AAC.1
MRLCRDPFDWAVASASARRARKAEYGTSVSNKPQPESVTSTRVMAGDVRVRNRGEMFATWCWVRTSSAKLQAGRQTNESAQSGRIAVPETEKSHGR